MGKVRLKIGDFIICTSVFLFAVCLFFFSFFAKDKANEVEVYSCGEILFTLPLSEDAVRTVKSNGYTLELSVHNGACSIIASDCPDGICRRSAEIHCSGDVIVCVPARVTVKVAGKGETYDAIAY